MSIQFAPRWTDVTTTQTCVVGNATDIASAANSTLLDLRVNNVSKFTVDKFGELIIAPTARTSGSDSLLNLIAPADTTRAAGVEATDINFNLARTVQFAAGNIADQRAVRIQAPTYSFASASTITNAATLSISGPPVAGTNATITNPFTLDVESGPVKLRGQTLVLSGGRIFLWNQSSYYFETGGSLLHYPVTSGHVQIAISHTGGVISGFFCDETVDSAFGWSDTANNAKRTRICRDADHVIAIRNSTNSYTFRNYNTFTNASNYERLALQFGTFSSARHAQIAAESAGTGTANINLVMTPRGTGALIAGPPPDGTAFGGNARGAYAVDLQLYRASASQVASGQDSFAAGYGCTASGQGSICIGWASTSSGIRSICIGDQSQATGIQSIAMGGGGAVASAIGAIAIGYYCTASGGTAFSVGQQNLASGARSVATGLQSLANKHGQRAHAAGSFTDASQSGQAQCVEMVLRNKTTDGTTAVTLFLDGASARLTVASGRILHATVQILGSKSDGSAVAEYMRQVCIKNVGGTTALVGAVNTLGVDTAEGTSIAITADDTNDALQIAVTGVASETWRWVAVVYGVELVYGT